MLCGSYASVRADNGRKTERTITCRLLCDIVRVIWNVSAFSKENMGVYAFVSAAFLIVLCGAKTRDIEGIKITVLDVGQGDGIVLSGKGKNYLIDGGSSDVKQAGAQRIEPYLLSEGIGCLDYVFVTHGDEDHISGIRELLEGQKLGVRIDTLVLPPEEYHDEKLADLARIAVENGTRVVSVKTGANIYGRGERQTEKTIQRR